jgi:hypothetical protein
MSRNHFYIIKKRPLTDDGKKQHHRVVPIPDDIVRHPLAKPRLDKRGYQVGSSMIVDNSWTDVLAGINTPWTGILNGGTIEEIDEEEWAAFIEKENDGYVFNEADEPLNTYFGDIFDPAQANNLTRACKDNLFL